MEAVFLHMQSRVMVSESENFPKTSPNFTVWGGGNSKKSGKNKRFLLIFTRFWCGRQELKTFSKRGISLFIRGIAFEHHNAHQKFSKIIGLL